MGSGSRDPGSHINYIMHGIDLHVHYTGYYDRFYYNIRRMYINIDLIKFKANRSINLYIYICACMLQPQHVYIYALEYT